MLKGVKTFLETNKGIIKCPFCRFTYGNQFPDYMIEIGVQQILDSLIEIGVQQNLDSLYNL